MSVRHGLLGAAALVAIGATALIGWTYWRAPSQAGLATDPAVIAAGRDLYAAECAICHGARLEGQPDWRRRRPDGKLPAPPHDTSGHTWHHPDAVLFGITRDGLVPPWAPAGYRSDMPAFGDRLDEGQIRAVLSFIASTWPDDAAARQRRVDAQSRQ